MSKWTRERIVREILRREANGLPLTSSVGDLGVDHALYQAASRNFGSWRNAIVAAGLPKGRARSNSEWTPARILRVIRALSRRRSRLCAHEIREQYGQLVPAARRCFGSWSKAVYAAGVDPQKLQRTSIWTRERVIEGILIRAIRSETLQRRRVKPRALVDAGTKLFGSWNSALAAAGVDSKSGQTETPMSSLANSAANIPQREITDATADIELHRRGRQWSEREILKAVTWRFQNNQPINATAVLADQGALYRAATKYYGNWKNTLTAAGLSSNVPRKS